MDIINPYIHGGEALTFDGFGNRSRSFNGVDEVVELNQSTPDNAIFTASTWVKLKTHNSSTGEGVFGKWQTASNGSWLIYVDATNIKFIVRNGANDAHTIVDSGVLASSILGDWTHVAGVADGTNLTIYINGVSEGSIAYDGTINNPTTAIVIGAYNHTVSPTLHLTEGNIADCRLYDTDLTATEISDLYAGTNITTNLVGHWLTDPDNVLDAAGTNHGTNYGSKYSYDNPSPPVEFGSASRSFDGVDDYVDLGNSNDFSFGDGANDSPFSVCFWAKLYSNNKFRAIGKNVTGSYEWLVSTDTAGLLTFYLISGTIFYGRRYNTALTENEWLHISATYDGTGGSNFRDGMAVYVNNVRVDDLDYGDNSYVAMTATSNPLEIAKFQTTYADGKMADVRLYDAELTASQVSDIYSGTDVQTNLIGHWLTDNDDVEDKAGTNDGTNFGSVYSYDNPPMDLVPSRQASRNFNGSSDKINVSDSPSFPTGAQTWSIWVKPQRLTFDTGGQDLMAKWGNQSAGDISVILFLANQNTGRPYFYITGDGSTPFSVASSSSLSVDTWHHVVGVFTPNTSIKIYVDSVLKGTNTTSIPSSIYDSSADFTLAHRDHTTTTQYQGEICDARIYDTDLTASQILDLYNGTTDRTNLVGQWLTNSDDVLDHAGTNDGTNNGSTYSTDSPS